MAAVSQKRLSGQDLDQTRATGAPWELFALRYAQHSGRLNEQNFSHATDPHEAGSNLDYFIWLAKRGDEVVVIDTGFGAEAAEARGRHLIRSPAAALAQLGVDPAAVATVILTHLHYDHAGGLGAFPQAQFHLQEAEAAWACGPCICDPGARAVFDVENMVDYIRSLYGGRITFHHGDHALAPGLSLHFMPGHSAGLQAVRVVTARGPVLIASDATHLYANLARRDPFPISVDPAGLRAGFDHMLGLVPSVDHIVPGHDPKVMQAYRAPSPALEGVAVRLDQPPQLSWEELTP